jgi:hypothetical protein
MQMRPVTKLCLVLMVTAATLGMIGTSTQRNADAAVCCSECPDRYQACYDGSDHPDCGGDPVCCNNSIHCYSFCDSGC